MRRFALTLGSLVAAGMLALAVPGSAVAAHGVLVINGTAYGEPRGCYESDRWPLSVGNHTDSRAYVFDGPHCSGSVIEYVMPGTQTVSEFGNSVYID
ncbi:hypothetical protein [Streptomyces lasiicapitis]|uniref:Uncharacterized protein n=1 Tax=Streptomyces lasiicapitis TaxID=1923961 RepID=A0ABQ2M5X1_9ACTN|nr:hypothetical protein [Streptomyces lasiicapitis]GGO47594.1 hypothetical protein GCM10012286_41250 [Streptomyces lasiicapitis]